MGRIRSLFEKFRPAAAGDTSVVGREKTRWLVVGLGNPGGEYARSRHNVGYRVVEALARESGAQLKSRKFKGLVAEARIGGEPAIIVKPLTYYNLSGECVAAVLAYFKIAPGKLIVVHDDLDLEPGRLRLKRGGGDAGNRGVRSIVATLGTPDFIRVRVGIGRPRPGADSKEHVLVPMSAREVEEFETAIERASQAVKAIIADGLELAMNRYNQRV